MPRGGPRALSVESRRKHGSVQSHLSTAIEPGLRSRATFRWAQLLLARGETSAPQKALLGLVRGKDAALGMDAALLLERCAPAERQRIWDTYLEVTTDPALRERAIRHRDGER